MDLAEIRLIREVVIKERRVGFLDNSAHPPSCDGPLKIPRHLIQQLAIRHLIAKCAARRTPL
jgi:hypothetical protein